MTPNTFKLMKNRNRINKANLFGLCSRKKKIENMAHFRWFYFYIVHSL